MGLPVRPRRTNCFTSSFTPRFVTWEEVKGLSSERRFVFGRLLFAFVRHFARNVTVDHVQHRTEIGVFGVFRQDVDQRVHVPTTDVWLSKGRKAFLRGKRDEHVGHRRQMKSLRTIAFVVFENQIVERRVRRYLNVTTGVIDRPDARIYENDEENASFVCRSQLTIATALNEE